MFEGKQRATAQRIRDEGKAVCGCGNKAFGGRYTPFTYELRRFRNTTHARCDGCSLGKGAREDGLHILWRGSLPAGRRYILKQYAALKNLCSDFCPHGMNHVLKDQTAMAKMAGEFLDPQWRLICYWEQLYGYFPYVGVDNMEGEARKWLETPNVLAGFFSPDQYADEMYLLNQFWRRPAEIPSIGAWLDTGRWVRGKAGTGEKTYVTIDGKTQKTRSMKGVDAALMTNHQIEQELYTPAREEFHVMEKSEGGKSRPVVKTSNHTNRKMDFLSEVIERGLYGTRFSTLYAGTAGNDKVDLELVELTRDRNYLKVPLDQKNFDQHQSKLTIQAVMGAIGDHLDSVGIPYEYTRVWKALWDSIFVYGATVKVGSKEFEWTNGLPSGWRWTAFLDTILNLASCRIIQRIVGVITREEVEMRN